MRHRAFLIHPIEHREACEGWSATRLFSGTRMIKGCPVHIFPSHGRGNPPTTRIFWSQRCRPMGLPEVQGSTFSLKSLFCGPDISEPNAIPCKHTLHGDLKRKPQGSGSPETSWRFSPRMELDMRKRMWLTSNATIEGLKLGPLKLPHNSHDPTAWVPK